MEYLSRLVVDDVEAIVLVTEATPIGVTTVRRISKLVDSLDLHVKRRVVALNKMDPPGVTGGLTADQADVPDAEAVIRVPYDMDLIGRCMRGDPVDADAGGPAREAVEELVARCLGLEAPQPGAAT